MFRCEFAICTIRLDRIRTRRYFSVSSMSVDEVCSNKSLLQFLKDTVTKEMTGSRSSIIYPHHPFLPIPSSSARHTSHPYTLTYIWHSHRQSLGRAWFRLRIAIFQFTRATFECQPLCHRDVLSTNELDSLAASEKRQPNYKHNVWKRRQKDKRYLLGETKGWRQSDWLTRQLHLQVWLGRCKKERDTEVTDMVTNQKDTQVGTSKLQ